MPVNGAVEEADVLVHVRRWGEREARDADLTGLGEGASETPEAPDHELRRHALQALGFAAQREHHERDGTVSLEDLIVCLIGEDLRVLREELEALAQRLRVRDELRDRHEGAVAQPVRPVEAERQVPRDVERVLAERVELRA